MEKWEAFREWLFTLDTETLKALKERASEEYDTISATVQINPKLPASGLKGALEDFLNRVDDYLGLM